MSIDATGMRVWMPLHSSVMAAQTVEVGVFLQCDGIACANVAENSASSTRMAYVPLIVTPHISLDITVISFEDL
jgi:hypothetical protein